jgi:hypothetical protein
MKNEVFHLDASNQNWFPAMGLFYKLIVFLLYPTTINVFSTYNNMNVALKKIIQCLRFMAAESWPKMGTPPKT